MTDNQEPAQAVAWGFDDVDRQYEALYALCGQHEDATIRSAVANLRNANKLLREIYAHPPVRVGVTEAMVEEAAATLYVEWQSDCWEDATDDERSECKSVARSMLEAALTAAPAPTASGEGVVELDEWRVVGKDGNECGTFFRVHPETATQADAMWPQCAPHRVMRVCLKPVEVTNA